MKIFRKVNEGIHPEIEIGRFLLGAHRLTGTCPTCSARSNWSRASKRSALAVVHRFVENQGDAWTVTAALSRPLHRRAARAVGRQPPEESPELASYLQRMRQIGRRTGELQSALASRTDIPDFAPGADQRRRHRRLDRAPDRTQRATPSTCWPPSVDELDEADARSPSIA